MSIDGANIMYGNLMTMLVFSLAITAESLDQPRTPVSLKEDRRRVFYNIAHMVNSIQV